MNRQSVSAAIDDQHARQAGASAGSDQDLLALVWDIRRIGSKLQSTQAVNHPRVRSALNQLDEQLVCVLGKSRGRHRLVTADATAPTDDGVAGTTCADTVSKPNPQAATTAAELVIALRQYRAWAGNVTFRQMAARARYTVPHAAMCIALNDTSGLPALNVVTAIIAGCGGNVEDQEMFAEAWRRIESACAEPPVVRSLRSVIKRRDQKAGVGQAAMSSPITGARPGCEPGGYGSVPPRP